jgi:hypothetical protein
LRGDMVATLSDTSRSNRQISHCILWWARWDSNPEPAD